MRFVSRFCVALVVGAALTCVASDMLGAPPAKPVIQAAPDTSEAARRFVQREQQKPDPKHENLQKLASAPKKFAFAAGAAVIAIVWNVFLVLAVIAGLLVLVYYVRRRAGGQTDRTEALAAAFDDAVKKIRTTRKDLQKKVNILAKRDVAPAAKKKVAKPRKRTTRAKK